MSLDDLLSAIRSVCGTDFIAGPQDRWVDLPLDSLQTAEVMMAIEERGYSADGVVLAQDLRVADVAAAMVPTD